MTTKAKIIATLASAPESELLGRLGDLADILEIRADLVGDLDVDHLRSHFRGELLYTLRSAAEGGRFDGDDVSLGSVNTTAFIASNPDRCRLAHWLIEYSSATMPDFGYR